MGQVFVDFDVSNGYDLDRMADGTLPATEVRCIKVLRVPMDPTRLRLFLPAELIAALGLRLGYEVPNESGGGLVARVFWNALLTFEDRTAAVEVVELPAGGSPVLGAIPMQALGIEPDLRQGRVRKLPCDRTSSYIRI